ncbi:XRE family transcriptional regulator [Clostridiaceae bacterium]|nr:XRE family transcriptional regulator [Clostridiaceae bacterium]
MSYPVIDPVATGNRINALRRDRGFSVAYIRDYLGFSTTNAIYKWLHGTSLPSVDNFLALSVLFNISINDMIIYH